MAHQLQHEHAGGFDALLRDLAARVTCESIMTPWCDVACVRGAHSRETKERALMMMDAGRFSSVPLISQSATTARRMCRTVIIMPETLCRRV